MDENVLFTLEGDSAGATGALEEIDAALANLDEQIGAIAASAGDLNTLEESFASIAGSAGDLDGALSSTDSALASVASSAQTAASSVDTLAGSADTAAGSMGAMASSADTASGALTSQASAADASAASTAAASDSTDGLAKKMGGLAGPLAIAGVALAAVGAVAVHMAGDFQESMTQLVTGAGESEANLKMVSDGILSMSTQVGESTKQLAQGMYMIESAGYHGAAGLNVLKAAAEGAKVGNADLGVVADGTTTIMTDFSKSGITASQAVNALIATVASGKTHMQDLSAALAQILPTASAAGVGLSDVMGAMATMTGEGVPAANAATYLRQTIIALEAPSKQTTTALENVGLTTKEVADAMHESLPDALKLITDAVGKKFPAGSAQYVEAIKAISGGSKQMQGMLDLTGDHMKTFDNNMLNIGSSIYHGKTSIAGWALTQQDFNTKMAQAGATVQVAMIKIGAALMPVATALIAHIVPAVTAFSTWASTHGQQLVAIMAILAGVIGGALVAALVAAAIALSPITLTAIGIAAAVGAAIGVIIALGIAFKNAYDHSKPFRTIVQTIASFIGTQLHNAMTTIMPVVHQAQQALAQFGQELSTRVGPAAKNVFAVIQVALRFLQSIWNAVWPSMSGILQGVWNVIQGIVQVAWSYVSGVIKIGLDLLGGNWKQVWADMQTMLSGIWDGIKKIVIGGMQALVSGILAGISQLLGTLAHIPGPIGSAASAALGFIHNMQAGINGIGKQMTTDASKNAAAHKAAVFKHFAEEQSGAIASMRREATGVEEQLKHCKNASERAALEKKLAVLKHGIQERESAVATAKEQASQISKKAEDTKTHVTTSHQNMAQNVISAMGNMKDQAVTKVQGFADGAKHVVQQGFDDVKKTVQKAVSTVVGWAMWLYNHNTYFHKFVDAIKKAFNDAKKHVQDAITTIKTFIGKIFGDIKTIAQKDWAFIHDHIVTPVQNAIGLIQAKIAFVKTWLEQKWNAIMETVHKAWLRFTSAISGVLTTVQTDISNIVSAITTPIDNLGTTLFNAGQNLITMLINGIKSMAGAVGKAAGDIAGKITGFLGFHSPTEEGPGATADRWMPALGDMLASGLRAQTSKVAREAQGIAAAMAQGIKGSGASGLGGTGAGASRYAGGLGLNVPALPASITGASGASGGVGAGGAFGAGGGAQAQLLAAILTELRGQSAGRALPLGSTPTSAALGSVTQQFGGINIHGVQDVASLFNALNELAGYAQENGLRGATLGLGI